MRVAVPLHFNRSMSREIWAKVPERADAELVESKVRFTRWRQRLRPAGEFRHHLNSRVVGVRADKEAANPNAAHLANAWEWARVWNLLRRLLRRSLCHCYVERESSLIRERCRLRKGRRDRAQQNATGSTNPEPNGIKGHTDPFEALFRAITTPSATRTHGDARVVALTRARHTPSSPERQHTCRARLHRSHY
jgi:hypothetical protein